MSDNYRILITGSRDWYDPIPIRNAIINECIKTKYNVVIVHGGARGADYLAWKIADELQLDVEVYKADWDTYGKAAGFVRNDKMVKLGADVCLAFIKNSSAGATMCADLAEKAGIPVKTWRYDDC
jgi:putative aminopeptidase FrvX